MLGWLANTVYSINPENPLMINPKELISPSDIIKENQIVIYEDRIVIFIPHAKWSRYADTNSMDPILDKGANGLQIIPNSAEEIHIGDIVTYDQIPGSLWHIAIVSDKKIAMVYHF